MDNFVDFFQLLRVDFETFHFFKREFSYSVHGIHAVYVSQKFYKTLDVIRKENGLETLTFSRKFFSSIAQILIDSHRNIQLWKKSDVEGSRLPWMVVGFATPGYISNFYKDMLREEYTNIKNSAVIASIYITELQIDVAGNTESASNSNNCIKTDVFLRVGMAFFLQADNKLAILEFDDSWELSRLQVALCQYGVRECIINKNHLISKEAELEACNPSKSTNKRKLNEAISTDPNDSINIDTSTTGFRSQRAKLVLELLKASGCKLTGGIFSLNLGFKLLPSLIRSLESEVSMSNMQNVENMVKELTSMQAGLLAVSAWNEFVKSSPDQKYTKSTEIINMIELRKVDVMVGKLSLFLQYDVAVANHLQLFPNVANKNLSKSLQDDWSALHGNPNDGEAEALERDDDNIADDVDGDAIDETKAAAHLSGSSSYTNTFAAANCSSVYEIINCTKTAMGSKLLQNWLRSPLQDLSEIYRRQTLVKILVDNPLIRSSLRDDAKFLRGFPDLGSLGHKLSADNSQSLVTLWDLLTIYRSIANVDAILILLKSLESPEIEAVDIDTPSPAVSSKRQSASFAPFVDELTSAVISFAGFRRLVEEIIDVDALNSPSPNYITRLSVGQRWIQIRPSYSTHLSNLHDQLQLVWTLILDEYTSISKKVNPHASMSDSSSTSNKKKPRKSSSSTASQSCVHLEYHHSYGFHLRVTKKEEVRVMKILKNDKSEQVNLLSSQRAGTLFQTKKLVDLFRKHNLLRSQYEGSQQEIVNEAIRVASTYAPVVETVTRIVGELDCLTALATAAVQFDWCAPTISHPLTAVNGDDDVEDATNIPTRNRVKFLGLRHPCVEKAVGKSRYIASDVELKDYECGAIITGPNMGGKSTFLRAVGIAVILSHIGSFVPATSAELCLCDRLLLRAGASDCAAEGVSTFMSEMNDMAGILTSATSRSLVLIDELGRCTSTHEGFGLAWAIFDELVYKTQCTTLFATHFHELTLMANAKRNTCCDNDLASEATPELEGISYAPDICRIIIDQSYNLPAVVNMCVEADVVGSGLSQEVVMKYTVTRGICSQSYGIQVARMAKFPNQIIVEAFRIASELDNNSVGTI